MRPSSLTRCRCLGSVMGNTGAVASLGEKQQTAEMYSSLSEVQDSEANTGPGSAHDKSRDVSSVGTGETPVPFCWRRGSSCRFRLPADAGVFLARSVSRRACPAAAYWSWSRDADGSVR